MASDFAIAQFRFLKKLLLVHGHWSYVRIARVVLFMLFKVLFSLLLCTNFRLTFHFPGAEWYATA